MFRQTVFFRDGAAGESPEGCAGNALRESGGESRRVSFTLQNGKSGAVMKKTAQFGWYHGKPPVVRLDTDAFVPFRAEAFFICSDTSAMKNNRRNPYEMDWIE